VILKGLCRFSAASALKVFVYPGNSTPSSRYDPTVNSTKFDQIRPKNIFVASEIWGGISTIEIISVGPFQISSRCYIDGLSRNGPILPQVMIAVARFSDFFISNDVFGGQALQTHALY